MGLFRGFHFVPGRQRDVMRRTRRSKFSVPAGRCRRTARLTKSMAEVAGAGEDHRDAVFVGAAIDFPRRASSRPAG